MREKSYIQDIVGLPAPTILLPQVQIRYTRTVCFLRSLEEVKLLLFRAVEQLAERSLPTPENLGSNPLISNHYIEHLCL